MEIGYGFVTDKKLSDTIKYTFKRYYYRCTGHREKAIENDVDSVIQKLYSLNFKYAAISWEGTIFTNRGIHKHEIEQHIKERDFSDKEWLVSGHLVDDEASTKFYFPNENSSQNQFYYLWPITIIVNLLVWNKIGRPKFGDQRNIDQKNLVSVLRSSKNIHSTYTPLSIQKSSEYEFCGLSSDRNIVAVRPGWNFINESLKHNFIVRNIPHKIRMYQRHTYAENNEEAYDKKLKLYQSTNSIFNDKLKMALDDVHSDTVNGASFSLYNSEGIITKNYNLFVDNINDVECIVNTCQGFKDFIFAYGSKFTEFNITREDKKYVFLHYDINMDIVNKRKNIIETWNGLDDSNDYKILLKYFSSQGEFLDAWNQYKKCRHIYVKQNLFSEYKQKNIKKIIDTNNFKKILLLYADIFQWESNLIFYGYKNLLDIEKNFIHHMRQDLDLLLTEHKDLRDEQESFELYV